MSTVTASAVRPASVARRTFAVLLGLHAIAHLAGSAATVGGLVLPHLFGVLWAVLAAGYAVTAVATWRGDPHWPHLLAGWTAASLVVVVASLWASVVGLVIDLGLLAVAALVIRKDTTHEYDAA